MGNDRAGSRISLSLFISFVMSHPWSCLFIIIWKSYRSILTHYLSGRERLLYPFSFRFCFIHCIWHGLALFLSIFPKYLTCLFYCFVSDYMALLPLCLHWYMVYEKWWSMLFVRAELWSSWMLQKFIHVWIRYTSTNQYDRTIDFDLLMLLRSG